MQLPNLKSLTKSELLSLLRKCDDEDFRAVCREINRRIKNLADQKHDDGCMCTDCHAGDKLGE